MEPVPLTSTCNQLVVNRYRTLKTPEDSNDLAQPQAIGLKGAEVDSIPIAFFISDPV